MISSHPEPTSRMQSALPIHVKNQNVKCSINSRRSTLDLKQVFSSNAAIRKKNGRRQSRDQDNGPPLNGDLADLLCRNFRSNDYSDIKVRLVMEVKRNEQPEVSVVTLSEAIAKAKNCHLDLIGVSLKQKPPVVKAADYNKLLFEMQKKSRDSPSDKKTKKLPQLKEFRFKAGIDDNDFERKAKNMIQYLEKGHLCQVSITCRRKLLYLDKELLRKQVQRVCDLAEEHVSQTPKIALSGEQRAVIKLHPKKQS
eukprot:CAMPEP_0172487734 /NCGR_PEP_ID=MMETSP1066-20121228/16929_1 /TAXON_ID=671091 /ORGANISM="Coscinodiscus wailesii, Strain CCMP2513" /LENGTH=252 /DNA_ID=CAMNT_0013254527 /DNA_START=291 /DNA_END=1049 /DNA_ORIENTATION=-